MKIEIYHDILAKKILEKMSGEKKMLRKVERLLQERHALYLENGKSKKNFLSQNDLDTISPFLTHLKISREQQIYINRSRQAQRRSAQLRLATIGVVIVILGLLGFSIHQTKMANQQTEMARQALIDLKEEKENVEKEKEKADQAEAEVAFLVQKVDEKSAKVIGKDLAPGSNINLIDDKKTSEILSNYAQKLEEEAIYYNQDSEKLSDASGIVHRVLNYLSSISDQIKKPDVSEARSTRELADWYHKQGMLTVINDPLAQRDLIRPGTIMYYGKSGQVYDDLSIEHLLSPSPNQVIMHAGIVTEMVRDENGKVISYTLFHGRRPGAIASRTYYHTVEPPRLGYPIFGNWNQQWVAVAYPII